MTKTMDDNTIILDAQRYTEISAIAQIFSPTLIYLSKGSIECKVKDTIKKADSDCILLISPFDNISDITASDDVEYTKIKLNSKKVYDIPSPVLISTLKSRPEGFNNVIDCKANPLFKVLFDKIVLEFNEDRPLRSTSLDNAIIQLLIELYRQAFINSPTRHIELITEIEKYIDAEYMNDITIEELGSKFYLDRYYLSHIFREYTGYSLKQYLTLSRLNESRILLSTTELSINEICTTIGFSDINNFIRYFRKEYSTTPLAYRKSIIG